MVIDTKVKKKLKNKWSDMYKLWVQVIEVNLVELRLNAENYFKMWYVAVIMLRG